MAAEAVCSSSHGAYAAVMFLHISWMMLSSALSCISTARDVVQEALLVVDSCLCPCADNNNNNNNNGGRGANNNNNNNGGNGGANNNNNNNNGGNGGSMPVFQFIFATLSRLHRQHALVYPHLPGQTFFTNIASFCHVTPAVLCC